ncbi:hypothetical protein NC652_024878 [Populus alba x Populus x berolinensis]|nr:hypothetical protein NC652_024878 [Populus alba x Populus x berolinensis]
MDRPREIEADGNSNPIQISRLALDIGGSLIKLVYFSRDSGDHEDPLNDSVRISNGVNGRLHFAKFETTNINDCLQFISANKLFFGDVINSMVWFSSLQTLGLSLIEAQLIVSYSAWLALISLCSELLLVVSINASF